MYDAKLVRWNTYDPMAEKYYGINPYVYCAGYPVNLVDQEGTDIYLKDVAEYENKIPKYSYSRVLDGDYGPYSINAYYNDKDEVVGYGAVKFVKEGRNRKARFDYIMTDPADIDIFSKNVALFSAAADLTYANGELSQGMIQIMSGERVSGLASLWEESLNNPSFYEGLLISLGTSLVIRSQFVYDEKVWQKAMNEPTLHNYPISFDKMILRSKPLIKNDGYRLYSLPGSVNNHSGHYEIGVRVPYIIDHRFFRPQ